MQTTSLTFRISALLGLFIFIAVQFFLLYNTYTIKSEHFYSDEREIINMDYGRAIVNDKLYPGGSAIIDSIFNKDIGHLNILFDQNKNQFQTSAKQMMDSIFAGLIQHNNVDKVLDKIIKKEHHFTKGYKYALIISKFDIAFKENQYIQIFPYGQSTEYKRIGGALLSPSNFNKVSAITVSSPTAKSYKIQFSLHIENNDRTIAIIGKMMPTFLLSLASIVSIASLFFITVNNWFKQKKLAEMQSDFINSISHEFNTPLTAIIIANKSLQNETIVPQTNQSTKLTDIIQRQTIRLNELFKQVLNLTRANTYNVKKEKQSLSILLTTIIEDYRTRISKESDLLQMEVSLPNDKKIAIDTFWFTTMIQNLIENGFKYNNKELKKVSIIVYNQNEKTIIEVKDNGIGMSEKTTTRIFEKFYRHNNKMASAGGLGLGLFYVKQCVIMHNWNIKIISKQSEGSTFVITI